MDNIGNTVEFSFSIFGHLITIDPINIMMTWIVMALILVTFYLLTRKLKLIPDKKQNMIEVCYEFVAELTTSTLGGKEGKRFIPFIFMIFTFCLISNWIGIIPNIGVFIGSMLAIVDNIFGNPNINIVINAWNSIEIVTTESFSSFYAPLLNTPNFVEPTRSVNTDLAMAIMVFIVVHVNSFKKKGIIEYLKQYWGDAFPCNKKTIWLAPINLFIYMNIISEISGVVSHSFRLFGNIFGGFLIFTIVSSLIHHLIIPVGLLGFFGLFSGLVQAFVFTMLAITYIGQKA